MDFDSYEQRANEAEGMVNKMIIRVDTLEKQRRSLENELANLKQKLAEKGITQHGQGKDVDFVIGFQFGC